MTLKSWRLLLVLFPLSVFQVCVIVLLRLAFLKRDEQAVWLEDCTSFLFPIVNLDFV